MPIGVVRSVLRACYNRMAQSEINVLTREFHELDIGAPLLEAVGEQGNLCALARPVEPFKNDECASFLLLRHDMRRRVVYADGGERQELWSRSGR